METYEKKYKELEGKIKKAYLYAQTDSTKAVLEDILSELKESEDEKIRKEIVRFIQMEVEDEIVGNKWIAWLEKKESVEEIVERCKNSWYNEGKIAGMAEGLSDDEKYQQGWHDAIEKQGEQNPYSGVSFKYNGHTWGMCARDGGVEISVDGKIKERVFIGDKPKSNTALEGIKEKPTDNANKVEPKKQ